MKKVLLFAIGACLVASASNAQNLKQSGNEDNLQVLFAPLGGQPISINGISFRKFNATGDRAWRLNLFIGYSTKKSVTATAGDTTNYPISAGNFIYGTNPEADAKQTSLTFGLRPGYEWHMAGTERLAPYWGVELLFSMTSVKTDSDHIGLSDLSYNTNTSGNISQPYKVYTTERKNDGSSTTFGLNLIAGCDYYIAKNISLGAELGFGFSTTSMPDITDQYVKVTTAVTGNFPNQIATYSTTVASKPSVTQGSSMQIGPNAVGQLKLGWLFN